MHISCIVLHSVQYNNVYLCTCPNKIIRGFIKHSVKYMSMYFVEHLDHSVVFVFCRTSSIAIWNVPICPPESIHVSLYFVIVAINSGLLLILTHFCVGGGVMLKLDQFFFFVLI